MFDIKDKIVLITGGAAGIGAEIVKTLLDEDIKHVTILDTDEENGLAIENELNAKHGNNKVKFIKCDVTQELEVGNVFRTVKSEQGYIDVVINNAGVLNEKLFAKTIEVNFIAVTRSTVHAWELMRKDEGGRGGTIINVSSIAAVGGFPIVPVYGATKAAVLKLSTTLGNEVHYSRTGVRVLTICFGFTTTKLALQEDIDSFDTIISSGFISLRSQLPMQTCEHAAQGLLEMYKKGKSASVWIVTNGKPAVDVTDKYEQSAESYNDIIIN